MKKIKKIVSLLLVAAVGISAMAGCTAKLGKDDVETIVWYMPKPVSDMSHQDMVEEAANKIIEKELGCKLHFEFIDSGSWNQKMSVIIQSGEEFDICFDSKESFISNAKKGAYVDLKEYVDEYGDAISKKVDKFAWDAVTFDGEVYAIPAQTFYVPYSSFAFKKSVVDKYNIDYKDITTFEQLDPVLETVKNGESSMVPVAASANSAIPAPKSDRFVDTSLRGIAFDTETEKYVSDFETEYRLGVFKKAYDYYRKGYIASDAVSNNELTSDIKTGRYFTFSGRRSDVKTTNLYGFDCVEAEPTYGIIGTTNIINALACVSATSKHPDKAVQVLNLIWSNPDLSNLLAYGIENVDYEVVSKEGEEKSVVPKAGADSKWSIWHNWLGPLWDQWDSTWNSTESLKEMEKLNSEAKVSPDVGFIPDTSDLQTEVAMISAIVTETISVFNTGSMPDFDEYYNAALKRLDDAGIDKVLKSLNKQYASWKKNK